MKAKRIYRGFVKKYIVFLLSAVLIVIISLAFMGWTIQRRFEMGEIPQIIAETLVDSPPELTDFSDVLAMNGWVQVLDQTYNVVFSKGPSPIKKGYRAEEVLEFVSGSYHDKFLYTIAHYPPSTDKGGLYLLIVAIPENKIKVTYDPENAPFQIVRPFFIALLSGGILFLLLISLNVLLYSYYTTHKLSIPLGTLLDGIQRMIHGERGVRIQLQTGDELEEIGQAFNQMVTELEDAREEREELETRKRQLISDISHDLKTPLASIQGYVEALIDGVIQPGQEQEYLTLIKDKAVKMNQLLTELFQFSKLDRAGYQLQLQSIDLAEFLRLWLVEHLPEIENRGFVYKLQIPEAEMLCAIDDLQLERALTNLLHNALKYNPAGTTITVTLCENALGYVIVIADDGVGIPQIVCDQVFQPFVRGDLARSATVDGSGLGLAIAQKVIEKHAGSITLKSQEGMGTEFTIWLPKGSTI